MRDPAAVAAMVAEVAARGGRLDYVVSNAAINPFMGWDETSVEEFDELFETNVRGTWVVVTEGAKQMIAEGHGGAIVHGQLDLGPRRRPDAGRLLRHEGRHQHAGQGARRGAGRARASGSTSSSRARSRRHMSAPLLDEPEAMQYYLDRIALHRIGDPAELAAAIAFLLSDDASYVTSATLLVDAGFIVNAEL